MIISKGINFHNYLKDYYFWKHEKFKNKKVFKNILLVLYGKKKDRGHIKERYEKRKSEYYKTMATLNTAIHTLFPQFNMFSGGY